MGFLDSLVITNNQKPDEQGSVGDLASDIADKLRRDPTKPVDVVSMSEAIAKQRKESGEESKDVFDKYLVGVGGGRRLASLKEILKKRN